MIVRACLSLFLVGIPVLPAVAQNTLIEMKCGERDRKFCVVSAPLPAEFSTAKNLSLVEVDSNESVPVQIDHSQKPAHAVWLIKELKANTVLKYRLSISNQKIDTNPKVTILDDGKHLNATVGKKPVLVYNHALVKSPIPDAPFYERSGYIHPVFSPTGEIVTDDFNPDHAHQHGIMFAWRRMKFQGRIFDPWNQKTKSGKIEHVETVSITNGPVFGEFKVKLKWHDLTAPSGSVNVLNELWTVRIYAFEDLFLFDLTSKQECATEIPVSIEKMHYGGMAFRGRASWFDDKSYEFTTSEGKNKENGNHSRPNWVNISGPGEKSRLSATIYCHTDNFRSPQFVRLHPKMPYFCFPPTVEKSFTIEPGKPYVSKYRFQIHSGEHDSKMAESVFDGYVNNSNIKIISDH